MTLLLNYLKLSASIVIIIFKMDHVIYNVDRTRVLVLQRSEDGQEEQVHSVCNIYNILITLNSCQYI